MLNFAVKNLGLSHNPICGMDKPRANTRTEYITADKIEQLLSLVSDQGFRDLLILSFDTEARPQEIKRSRADQIDVANQRAVIRRDEAKKEIQRAIYFPTDRSWQVILRLMEANPQGTLLRNSRGNPWTDYAVKCRLA